MFIIKIIENENLRILISETGFLIRNKKTNSYSEKVYLGKFASLDDFEEVEDRDIGKKLAKRIDVVEDVNDTQYIIIDTTMLALDEIFIMIESILMTMPIAMSSSKNTEKEVKNPMVELYVVMIQRGLKTIDQVPERYRSEVKALLEQIEK